MSERDGVGGHRDGMAIC